jgi:WD40 repeat protein
VLNPLISHYRHDRNPAAARQLNLALIDLRRTVKELTGFDQSKVRSLLNELFFGSDPSTEGDLVKPEKEIPPIQPRTVHRAMPNTTSVISQGPLETYRIGTRDSQEREFIPPFKSNYAYMPVMDLNSDLIFSGSYGVVRMWSLDSGQEAGAFEVLATPYRPPNAPEFFRRQPRPFGIFALASSSDGQKVYAGGSSNQIVELSIAGKTSRNIVLPYGGIVTSIRAQQDYLLVATFDESKSGNESVILSLDPSSGREIDRYILSEIPHPIHSVTIDRDGKLMVASRNMILTIDRGSKKIIRRVPFNAHPLATSIVLSPDGKSLMITDGSVHVLSCETGQEIYRFTGDPGWAYSSSLSPDRKYLYTTDSHGIIREWPLPQGIHL